MKPHYNISTVHLDGPLRSFIATRPEGITTKDAQAFFDAGRNSVQKNLNRLLADGRIVKVCAAKDGRLARYCTPEHWDALYTARMDELERHRAEDRRKSNERRQRKRAAARAALPPKPAKPVKPPKVEKPLKLVKAEKAMSSRRRRELEILRTVAEFEAPVIQRIVPAHLAEPLRPRGPCSVWSLAA